MFTAAESAEVWDRWQRGDGLSLIGRVFDRSSGAIFQHLKPYGKVLRRLPETTVES
jgi:transposase, IS30 family